MSKATKHLAAALLSVAVASVVPSAAASQATQGPEPAPVSAIAEGAFNDEGPRVVTTLIADAAGDRIQVGVLFEVALGWHIYWKSPGQTGLSTDVTFSVGDEESGVEVWPAPSVFQTDDGFITSFGYAGDVVLVGGFDAPAAAAEVRVRAVADYLVCDSSCIPGRNEMELVVRVGERASAESEARLENAQATTPVDAADLGWTLTTPEIAEPLGPGESIDVVIGVDIGPESEPPPASGMLRMDAPARMLAYERVTQLSVEPLSAAFAPEGRRGVLLTVRLTAGADPVAEDQVFSGVLLVNDRIAQRAIRISFPIPRTINGTYEP